MRLLLYKEKKWVSGKNCLTMYPGRGSITKGKKRSKSNKKVLKAPNGTPIPHGLKKRYLIKTI